MGKTSCKKGQYYCNTDKKCKPIPDGYKVREDGFLVSEGSLRDWFGKSKSKDGKPGWVNVTTGGTCASDEPGEGVPKCVSRSKYESMTPAERRSASRRKKKKDKGQQEKRNASKPTYVATDKPKKKMKEEFVSLPLQLEVPQNNAEFRLGLMFRENLEQDRGMLFIFESNDYWTFHMKNTLIPLDIAFIKEDGTIESIKELNPMNPNQVGPDSEIRYAIEVNRGWFAENGVVVGDRILEEEEELIEGKDKKGKGSGSKDACYHKVKSRYSVWPSAYASGALVKCRKVGAANWGNKSESVELGEGQKCWKGYEKKGTKKMFGKTYNNCVKKEEYSDWREEIEYLEEIPGASAVANYIGKMGVKAGAKQIAKRGAKRAAKRAAIKVAGKSGGKAAKKAGTVAARETKKAAAETAAAVGAGAAKGLKKRKEKFVAKVKRKSEEIASGEGKKKPEIVNEFVDKQLDKIQKSAVDTAQKSGAAMSKELVKGVTTAAAIGAGAYVGAKILGKGVDALPGGKKKKKKKKKLKEGAAWTKKSGKNPSGGLNEKGRKSYERENPGSDLKAPSKKVGNKRRSSFCARMKGMKKKLTSAKTANDPDSRINKSLRKWNC